METRPAWRLSHRLAATLGMCLVVVVSARAAESEQRTPGVALAVRAGGDVEWAVLRALVGAYERLGRSSCQQILSDFNDAQERPLRSRLDAAGLSAQARLAQLLFYDGTPREPCRRGVAVATALPGTRVVFICKDRFLFQQRNNPMEVELALIHEMLHSLGLGEDPPSSDAISARVMYRCR